MCQAAKAIELMEDSQRKQVESSSATIKDLTEKVECLQVCVSWNEMQITVNLNMICFDSTFYHIFLYRVKSIH